MKRFLYVSVLALAPAAPLVACASSRSMGEQVDDSRISRHVAAKLVNDPEIRKYPIDVDTVDRVVILRGEVDSKKAKRRAERIAYDTEGVMKVENLISLEGKTSGTKRHGKAQQAKDGAGVTANDDVIGDPFDENPDMWISLRVRSAFADDDDIKAREIGISTEKSVVTLSGKVADAQTIERAERIARRVEGVKDVKNELTVVDTTRGKKEMEVEVEKESILKVEPDSILNPSPRVE